MRLPRASGAAHDGIVGFVANQMEVLEDMWMRSDEYIDVETTPVLSRSRSAEGRGRAASRWSYTRSMSFAMRDGKDR